MTTAHDLNAPRTPITSRRDIALVAARVMAGLLGLTGLAGMVFFLVIAPHESVWVGLWLDVPVVALMLAGFILKLAVGLLPRLPAQRRIGLGLIAVAIGIVVTLVKIPVYDEPEGVMFLIFDAVLLVLLILARRRTTTTHGAVRGIRRWGEGRHPLRAVRSPRAGARRPDRPGSRASGVPVPQGQLSAPPTAARAGRLSRRRRIPGPG